MKLEAAFSSWAAAIGSGKSCNPPRWLLTIPTPCKLLFRSCDATIYSIQLSSTVYKAGFYATQYTILWLAWLRMQVRQIDKSGRPV